MLKAELIALIQKQHDDKASGAVAAVDAEYQPLLDAANSLDVAPDESGLQQQLSDANAKIADLQAKLDAEIALEAQDQIDMAALKDKLSKDSDALAQVKSICDALLAPQA